MRTIRHIFIFLSLLSICLHGWAADNGSNDVENQLIATYIYKFVAYVEWPPTAFSQPNAPLTIGVIGADEVAADLRSLIGDHPMNNRTVEVKILKPNDSMTSVQILFIGTQENAALTRILNSIQSHPVLTVTESSGALDAGSIINLVTVEDHMRFEVSVAQADRASLKISSRLLNVAQKIESRRP
jgi:hypothetical protein